MGSLTLKECLHPGCRELTTSSRCPVHARKAWADADLYRGTRTERGYDNRWLRARADYIKRNPLCVHCHADGVRTAATEVDHTVPHRGDKALFWDVSNWQALCTYHHRIKTASEAHQ